MRRPAALLLLALAAAAPAAAEDARIGDDLFQSGEAVSAGASGIDDVFAAGDSVDLTAAAGGSVHLAGRNITVSAPVAGNLYSFGGSVTVAAPVTGDAALAAYDVTLKAPLTGDLRAAGRNVTLDAPVGGSALIAGDRVTIDAAVAGDATITARSLTFGPEGRVDGHLTVRGGDEAIPSSAVAPERVDREPAIVREPAPRWGEIVAGYAIATLISAILVALMALIAPRCTERVREIVSERPGRSLWIGFLAQATLIGAVVLAILSLIGIPVAPLILIAAVVLSFIGYLIGVWTVGRAAWRRFDSLPPDGFGERLATALLGAIIVGLVTLVPFAGWLVGPLLTLAGLGGLTIATLRPEFRT